MVEPGKLTSDTEAAQTRDQVREYYGQRLQSTSDLRTQACCTADAMPEHMKAILHEIDDEILARFYGCGSPIPPVLDGCTVLDLGCGTGRDVYIASKLVGASGHVIGVDMTEPQLDIAKRHVEAQARRFGYDAPNVSFHLGGIEDLSESGIEDDSVDVVLSNCVINLSPEKRAVFKEIFRVLKPGGELLFSDIFADRRVPASLTRDQVVHGECLGGAMYVEDFRRLMGDVGCLDYRITTRHGIAIDDAKVAAKVGSIRFDSITVRAFKLDDLEDRCEDYGQVATYKGTIEHAPHAFDLDDHHRFVTGKPMLVCGNTAAMLQQTRYAEHFTVAGDRSTHFGLFECASGGVSPQAESDSGGACC